MNVTFYATQYVRSTFGVGSETFENIINTVWGLQMSELALYVIGECEDKESVDLVDTLVQIAFETGRTDCRFLFSFELRLK